MAITIDELHVEATPQPASAQANASNAPAAGAKKDMSLGQVLELLQERTLRLQAD
jgi:hypothetical protein